MAHFDGYVATKWELDPSLESLKMVRGRLLELRNHLINNEEHYYPHFWFLLLEVEDMLNMQIKRVH
jgi:hypothetical protein